MSLGLLQWVAMLVMKGGRIPQPLKINAVYDNKEDLNPQYHNAETSNVKI